MSIASVVALMRALMRAMVSALEVAPAFGGMGRLAMGLVQGQVLLGPEQRAGVRCRGEQQVAPLAAALIGRPNRKSTLLSSYDAINAGRA